MSFNANYEYFVDGTNPEINVGIDPNNNTDNSNVTISSTLATGPVNTEIVIKGKDEYDSLYTVNLNFSTDITNMNANVLSEYINKRLSNHPYYIDVSKIVSIDVNDDKNSISITVSNKEVEERLIDLQDAYINLTSVIEDDIDKNIYNYNDQNNKKSEKDIKLINDLIPKEQKYVINYENPKGEVKMYEYDFNGFEKAKSLNYNKHINVNENTKRHFLRNDNDKPYFYDEYVDSENNQNNQEYKSINPEDPLNVKRNLYNQLEKDNENQLEKDNENQLEKDNDNQLEKYNEIQLENEEDNDNQLEKDNENQLEKDNEIQLENENKLYINNELNNIFNNSQKENKNQYVNYFIIFLILICVLSIFFILFNYVLKK